MVIAIDGPAGAGKSTVARSLARALGAAYLDSGAMYRCVALLTLREGEQRPPGELAVAARIELGPPVLLDGIDVTQAIRAPAVTEAASVVAADSAVRAALVAKQRSLLAAGDWVAEGRDIGTVVAPDAALKVFLTASALERARRRASELDTDPETVLAAQAARDGRDTARADSPLEAAPDAVVLDTTGRSLDDVVATLVGLAR